MVKSVITSWYNNTIWKTFDLKIEWLDWQLSTGQPLQRACQLSVPFHNLQDVNLKLSAAEDTVVQILFYYSIFLVEDLSVDRFCSP